MPGIFPSHSSISQNVTSETMKKADIFSLGVMMYQICSGRNIRESGEDGLYRNLRTGRAEDISGLVPGLNGLIQRCLDPDHTQRPSARDILVDKVLLQVSVSEKKHQAQLAQRDAALVAAKATIAQLKNEAVLRPPLAVLADTTQSPRAGTSRGAKFVNIVQLAQGIH